jgi:hypothetical protein
MFNLLHLIPCQHYYIGFKSVPFFDRLPTLEKKNRYSSSDSGTYQVFTFCEKLFTLQISTDGNWKTLEANVILINKALITEIGDVMTKNYTL